MVNSDGCYRIGRRRCCCCERRKRCRMSNTIQSIKCVRRLTVHGLLVRGWVSTSACPAAPRVLHQMLAAASAGVRGRAASLQSNNAHYDAAWRMSYCLAASSAKPHWATKFKLRQHSGPWGDTWGLRRTTNSAQMTLTMLTLLALSNFKQFLQIYENSAEAVQ